MLEDSFWVQQTAFQVRENFVYLIEISLVLTNVESVNPESDPLGALLSLDVHALSAKQYRYVVQMYSNWKTSGELYPVDLTSLPNFSFSAAYAQYKLEGGKSHQKSSEMLQEAIVKFPSTIPRLFEKLGESGSVNEQHFLQM